jgi:LAS superfamily LD-carboxypeptidase LdcB
MRSAESGTFAGESSPFADNTPLRIMLRPEAESFFDGQRTDRLVSPWLDGELFAESLTEEEAWSGSTDQIDFRDRVLSAHLQRSRKRSGPPRRDLRPDELRKVRGTGVSMAIDAAAAAGRLIEAANQALAEMKTAADVDALRTISISATSGYRGSDHQRDLWQKYFPGYYRRSRKGREALSAGAHSDEAVSYMFDVFRLSERIAAPGYSNHQAGIAIDLWQQRIAGHEIENKTDPEWRAKWRASWFHGWLIDNAAAYGFVPYVKEEWHWEYKPQKAAAAQTRELLDEAEDGEDEAFGEDSEAAEDEAPPAPAGDTILQPIDLKIGNIATQVLIQTKPEKKYKAVQVSVKPRTGIFVPDGYRAGGPVDLVIYLHGHTVGYPGMKTSIDEYWADPNHHFPLREQVNDSGKNVVLAAPTLGPRSEAGTLDDAGGLDSFVSEVLGALGDQSPAFGNRQPQIGNIVLAGHSGAGKPMLRIAQSATPMAAKIRECWLFDALYGGAPDWERWIRAHPRAMFYTYHATEGPSRNSRKLEERLKKDGITNAVIFPSAEMSRVKMPGHFDVPKTFFVKRLRDTSWMSERTRVVPELEEPPESETDEIAEEEFDSSDELEDEEGEEEEEEEQDLEETDSDEAPMDEEEFGGSEPEAAFESLLDSETVFPSGESLAILTGLPDGKGEEYWDPKNSGNPLLDTGPAHKDKHLSANLTVRELTTSGGLSADVARIDPKLVDCVQRLLDFVGKRRITITSGFRSWKRNSAIYAKRKKKPTLSEHCSGRAVDIHIEGMNGLEIGKAAIDAYGPRIGVGLASNFAHIDVRGVPVAWDYGGATIGWVAEIQSYQKQKARGTPPPPKAKTQSLPAPRPPAVPPAGLPALGGAKVPKDYTQHKRGLERSGGGRLDRVLRDLRARGLLSVTDDDIDTFQRVANVETSGLTQALNTWDSAVVSIGFMQWTLQYQELHRWIGEAVTAFQRFGIEIDPTRRYTIGGEQVPAIKGAATAEELRWNGWAQRFYLAGLDPEIIAAEVAHATAVVVPGKLKAAKGWLKGNAEGVALFLQTYRASLPFRGLFIEAHNNRPAAAKAGVKNGIGHALRDAATDPGAVYQIMREEILAAYAVQGERSKGKNVVEKTAHL